MPLQARASPIRREALADGNVAGSRNIGTRVGCPRNACVPRADFLSLASFRRPPLSLHRPSPQRHPHCRQVIRGNGQCGFRWTEAKSPRHCTRLSARADAAQVCHSKLVQHAVSRSIRVPCGRLAAERTKLSRRFPSFAYQPRSTFLQDTPRELRGGQVQGQHLGSDGRTHEKHRRGDARTAPSLLLTEV